MTLILHDAYLYFILILMINHCFSQEQISDEESTSIIFNRKGIDSCKGKCNTARELPCSCDARCVVYDNCCLDIEEFCPGLVPLGKRLFSGQVEADSVCDNFVFMIASCPNKSMSIAEEDHLALALLTEREPADFEKLGKTSQQRAFWRLLQQAPVTELSTGINYRNFSVYSCFSRNLSDFQMFDMSVVSQKFVSLTTLDKFVDSLTLFTSRINYLPRSKSISKNVVHSRCFPIFNPGDKCNETDANELSDPEMSSMRDKCFSGFSFVENRDYFVYKNKYCAFCNGEKISKLKHLIRPPYEITKTVFQISLTKQHLLMNYEFGRAPMDYGMIEGSYGSWVLAKCQLESDGACEVLKCSRGYTRRPSGLCAIVYGIGVAFYVDANSDLNNQLNYIDILINCHLSYLDFSQSHDRRRFVFKRSQTDERLIIFQLNVYSDRMVGLRESDQRGVLLISKIVQIAKSIFIYQRNISEEYIHYEQNSLIHLTVGYKHETQAVEDVVHSLNEQKGHVLMDMGHVGACVCINELQRPTFDCRLICFHDQLFEKDLELLNTSHTCFERSLGSNKAGSLRLHVFALVLWLLF